MSDCKCCGADAGMMYKWCENCEGKQCSKCDGCERCCECDEGEADNITIEIKPKG